MVWDCKKKVYGRIDILYKYMYMFVCVCACMHACMRLCVQVHALLMYYKINVEVLYKLIQEHRQVTLY